MMSKRFFLVLVAVIGFELSAISQNDCNCNDAKSYFKIVKNNEYYKKHYAPEKVEHFDVYVIEKECRGADRGGDFRESNYCLAIWGFSDLDACKKWIEQNAKKRSEQHQSHNLTPLCFKCIQCNNSGSSSNSNNSNSTGGTIGETLSPLVNVITPLGNETADLVVGTVLSLADAMGQQNQKKSQAISEERRIRFDEEVARKEFEKQNKIESQNLRNSNIYLTKKNGDSYALMEKTASDHGLNFQDYITRALWEKDFRDMSNEEFNTFIREGNRFWKDYYGANELSLISEEVKAELIGMGIDIAEIVISGGVVAATSILATPFGGMVINAAAQPVIAGTAECFRAMNQGKSCNDPAVLRKIAQSGTKSLLQSINTESALANIAIKIATDIGTSEIKGLSPIAYHGIKVGAKEGAKTWGSIVIDSYCDGCSTIIEPVIDIVDVVTPKK